MIVTLCFVDSNLLVYTRDSSNPVKQQTALKWMTALWQSQRGRLSTQVLNEFYVVVTRKLKPTVISAIARKDVQDLMRWQPIAIDSQVIEKAWIVQDDFHLSWWDSLIVASAQIANCQYLLTEDLQHNQQLDSIKVINPFIVLPQDILKLPAS
jgi:predicted nucleic acid-binding protein